MRFPIKGRPARRNVVAIATLLLAMLIVDALVGGVLGLLFGGILVLVLLMGLWFSLKSPDWYIAVDDNSIEICKLHHQRISFTKIVSIDTPTSRHVVMRFKGLIGWRIGPLSIPQGSLVVRMDNPETFVAEARKRIGRVLPVPQATA